MTTQENNLQEAVLQERLLRQAREGDREAMEALIKPHIPMLLRVFRRKAKTPDDADDMVQDVCCQATLSIRKYRGLGSFSAWLLGIALNRTRNYYIRDLTHQSRNVSLAVVQELTDYEGSEEPSVLLTHQDTEQKAYIEHLLKSAAIVCSPIEYRVLLLTYQGDDNKEIALALRLAAQDVPTHLLRARLKLLTYLHDHAPEMLGGTEAIEAAWKAVEALPDSKTGLTGSEKSAKATPAGQIKEFRKAVMKMARFLPIPLAIAVWVIGGKTWI